MSAPSRMFQLVKPLTSAARLVQADNVNRRDDTAEARSVEAAISVLSVNDDADAADRHPERCAHAALYTALCRFRPRLRTLFQHLALHGYTTGNAPHHGAAQPCRQCRSHLGLSLSCSIRCRVVCCVA